MSNQKIIIALLFITLSIPLASLGADPFADLPDPTRHKKSPKPVVNIIERKNLVLQSTLVSGERSSAVINGKQVVVGNYVEGARLIAINPFNVVIEQNGRERTLELITADVVRDSNSSYKDD